MIYWRKKSAIRTKSSSKSDLEYQIAFFEEGIKPVTYVYGVKLRYAQAMTIGECLEVSAVSGINAPKFSPVIFNFAEDSRLELHFRT